MKNRQKLFRKAFYKQFELLTHSQKCACGWRAFDLFYSMTTKSGGGK